MVACRRILKAFWFSAVLSIMLSVAVVATSVLDKTCPVVAAGSGDSVAEEAAVKPPKESPEPPHPKVIARVWGGQDADVSSKSGKVTLHVPKGAVGDDRAEIEIELVEHGQWGAKGSGMFNVFELNAYLVQLAIPAIKIGRFNRDLTISIKHTPEELAGLDVDTLRLYYLDEDSGQWVPLGDSRYDSEAGILTATTDHFSYYAEMANPIILGPGKVMAYLVDMHSGASTSEYAIEVPPGSGGFQPSIVLRYNSASVDEMKNKKAVGSWVGIGWSLALGSISYEENSGEYLLSLDGASYYELVQDVQGGYHTNPESFYKISRTSQQWNVYDREGRYYRFGGTSDSQQYHDNSIYYRWDLSYIRDVNTSNAITITYVQDPYTDSTGKNHIRSAYPYHVQYNNGNVDIQFNSSHDGAGLFRNDNPRSPAPKVVENRKLDSIDIRVGQSLVRQYVLAYSTTGYSAIPGYNEDQAGTHTLTSITEYDSNGVSGGNHLPATTFTYTWKAISHYDDDQISYGGNPGNRAYLSWPYLTTVTNGYGATVTYSYDQKPWSDTHTWTRNVVTNRVVNPGIGDQQTYVYTYNGNPAYFKAGPGNHGWNDEYRGFSQVKETDAQGNYTWHYHGRRLRHPHWEGVQDGVV